jgi:hypothetical protein
MVKRLDLDYYVLKPNEGENPFQKQVKPMLAV